jgi:hypothetical protein
VNRLASVAIFACIVPALRVFLLFLAQTLLATKVCTMSIIDLHTAYLVPCSRRLHKITTLTRIIFSSHCPAMPTKACTLQRVDSRLNLVVPERCQFSLSERVHLLGLVNQTVSEGLSLTRAAEFVGISKASLYRWQKDLLSAPQTYFGEATKNH